MLTLKIFALIVGIGTGAEQTGNPELFVQFTATQDPCVDQVFDASDPSAATAPTSCPQQVDPLYVRPIVVDQIGQAHEWFVSIQAGDTPERLQHKVVQLACGQYRRGRNNFAKHAEVHLLNVVEAAETVIACPGN